MHKYRAKPRRDSQGNYFASSGEFERWRYLLLLEKSGQIRELRRQIKIPLLQYQNSKNKPSINYNVDFSYLKDGVLHYEDFKGVDTREFKRIKILWSLFGPAPLVVTKKKNGRFAIMETIEPMRCIIHDDL